MDAKSAINKRVTFGNKKKILPNGKMVVLLQRLNFKGGTRPLTRVVSLFCTHLSTMQTPRFAVCGSSNARKDQPLNPRQHRRPFLFNVLKLDEMNASTKTAGETARENLIGATYAERKDYMHKCLTESSTAVLVYFDEDCKIHTCGIAERGFESSLLPMLEDAAATARRVAEEVML
jgi:hypothetical protein